MFIPFFIVLTAAAAPAASAPTTSAPASDPGAAIECRKFPPPVGTRLGARRICKTVNEWNLERGETRQDIEKIQTQGPGPLGT